MPETYCNISEIPRKSKFPLQLQRFYFCRNYRLHPSAPPLERDWFEVSLRLESAAEICRDIVNGKAVEVPFPNATWKMPRTLCHPGDDLPRDVVSLLYPESSLKYFEELDMIPEEKCLHIPSTQEIKKLVQKLKNLSANLHTPGVIDEMDWLAFSLIKTILLENRRPAAGEDSPAIIVKNVAAWLKIHCCEEFDLMEQIRRYGISHTLFYQEWHKHFERTPHQEIMQERLNIAAQMLRQTSLPIAAIVKEVRFSGTYAFHKAFQKKFGQTPGDYRAKHTDRKNL